MIVRRFDWARFALPFRRAFATAHGALDAREGFVVRLLTERDRVGLGEASAVPGFGGSLAAVEAVLGALAPRLRGRDPAELDDLGEVLDPTDPAQAAVAFAVGTAALDLRGQEAGLPIARLLGGDPERPIPVHAPIGAPTAEGAVAAACEAVGAGFGCVKLKVGVARSERPEIDRIGAVREAIGPSVRLRLDANEAWGVDEAVAIIRAAERFDLDLIEQPVDRRDLAGMARVRRGVATPIAADEAATGLARAREVIAAGAADVLVVKPMLAGGWRAARRMVDEAARAGLGAFVTTTLDSGIGVAAAVQLAATLPSPLLPSGLATGSLLADDLVAAPPPIPGGAMRASSRPGLGVALDEDAARRLLGPWQAVGDAGPC